MVDALLNHAAKFLSVPATALMPSRRLPSPEYSRIQAVLGDSSIDATISPRVRAKGCSKEGTEEEAVGELGQDRLDSGASTVGEAGQIRQP